jgi:hypothetical protein
VEKPAIFRFAVPAVNLMITFTRKRIGVLLAVLAPILFVALALGDVQLVTISSRHLEATGATSSTVHLHWPVVIPLVMFTVGVALALFPRHENAAN